jgi:hypothetical protein
LTVSRYVPLLFGVLLIVGLTIQQIRMTDRLSGTNVSAIDRAKLIDSVPKDFGDWHGEDKPVDPTVQKVAGAVGAVSRSYRNSRTGERVDLWLIIGHSRDVAFHTPDVCYRGSGFEARGKENSNYNLVLTGLPDTPMWTNTFFKEDVTGRTLIRVFWTWYNPESSANEGKIVWEAPTNARFHFGNSRALYKMYFTSEMRDPMETAEQSSALRFAKDFLPEVDKALAETKLHEDAAAEAANKPGTPAAKTAAEPADSAKPESDVGDGKATTPAADNSTSSPPAEAPASDADKK